MTVARQLRPHRFIRLLARRRRFLIVQELLERCLDLCIAHFVTHRLFLLAEVVLELDLALDHICLVLLKLVQQLVDVRAAAVVDSGTGCLLRGVIL